MRPGQVLHQVHHPRGIVAKYPVLVLVDEANAGFLGQAYLVAHSLEHFITPLAPVAVSLALGGIVAEDTNIAGAEDFAQLNGTSKAFQVWFEWVADLYLADRRADGAELEAVLVEQ